MATSRIKLLDSTRNLPEGKKGKAVNDADTIEVTLRIRRKKSIEEALKELEATGKTFTRQEYIDEFTLDESDVNKVTLFASENELSVFHISYARRSVILRGTAKNFMKAFGVKLNYYTSKDGITFRGRSGAILIPKELAGIVQGVFGLDDRPQASKHIRTVKKKAKNASKLRAFNPDELCKIYNFPAGDGHGQTIGILQFGGGHVLKDLRHYFKTRKINPPQVKSVSVGSGHNNPYTSADDEEMMDIEIAQCAAPKAQIVLYYAPNTSKGWIDAITQAIHDKENKPSVISISWGMAEKNWSTQLKTSFNEACKAAALLGVTICAASGDNGADDDEDDEKAHVDFPSSCPYILCCGGTRLLVDKKNNIVEETVWNVDDDSATGGGISDFFPLPAYQKNIPVPLSQNKSRFNGRGMPDVSAVADPYTGYRFYLHSRFRTTGGTSAVSPLMAGLVARINQIKKKKTGIGFIHPKIYNTPQVFRDITNGNNINRKSKKGFSATTGWDACTGLGVPDGKKLAGIF